jgi:hypothetical protein
VLDGHPGLHDRTGARDGRSARKPHKKLTSGHSPCTALETAKNSTGGQWRRTQVEEVLRTAVRVVMEPALWLIQGDAHQWSEQTRSCPIIRGSGYPTN